MTAVCCFIITAKNVNLGHSHGILTYDQNDLESEIQSLVKYYLYFNIGKCFLRISCRGKIAYILSSNKNTVCFKLLHKLMLPGGRWKC